MYKNVHIYYLIFLINILVAKLIVPLAVDTVRDLFLKTYRVL